MSDDIPRLKMLVSLPDLALSRGFRELPHDKWINHLCMRRGKGERIYVSMKPWGWFFWQPSSGAKGSSIDFLKRFDGMSGKEAIDELREWSGQPVSNGFKAAAVEIADPKDLNAVRDRIERMARITESNFLERERGIPRAVFSSWRFAGRILSDDRGNVVFPHSNGKQWCGGEVRNWKYKGFMKGGERGLALSKTSALDKRLILTEGFLDSLAWCALNDDGATRYGSFGGSPSGTQSELLKDQIYRMRPGSEIVWAGDSDAAGEKAAEFVKAACEVALQDGAYVRHSPAPHKDFNDALRMERSPTVVRLRTLIPA